jgi:hypothetical protein
MRPNRRLQGDFGALGLDDERPACAKKCITISKSTFLIWKGEPKKKKNTVLLFTLSGWI